MKKSLLPLLTALAFMGMFIACTAEGDSITYVGGDTLETSSSSVEDAESSSSVEDTSDTDVNDSLASSSSTEIDAEETSSSSIEVEELSSSSSEVEVEEISSSSETEISSSSEEETVEPEEVSSSSEAEEVSSSSTEVEEESSSSEESMDLIDSRDGQIYKTTIIGTQTWMAENLNYEITTEVCTSNEDGEANCETVTEGNYCYNNSATNCVTYGRLYTWEKAMEACPTGWHLPDTTEWNELVNFIIEDQNVSEDFVGTYLKSTTGWSDEGNGNNTYGFSALPAGYRYSDSFNYLGYSAYFWSATGIDGNYAYLRYLYFSGEYFRSDDINKEIAFSVRCLKDSD